MYNVPYFRNEKKTDTHGDQTGVIGEALNFQKSTELRSLVTDPNHPVTVIL